LKLAEVAFKMYGSSCWDSICGIQAISYGIKLWILGRIKVGVQAVDSMYLERRSLPVIPLLITADFLILELHDRTALASRQRSLGEMELS
jgi:hypothetical protein